MKSPFTHFVHAQLMQCSCNFIQLHIPCSWIKLSRTVHQQAHGNLLFLLFLPSFSAFLTFLTLLCLHVCLQRCCVLCLLPPSFSPSVSKLSPSFPVSLQWLCREFCLEPQTFQIPTLHPSQSPFPSSALPVWLPHHPHHWNTTPVLDFPKVLLQPPTGFKKTQPKENLPKIHPDSEGKKIRPSQGSLGEGSLILNK